MDKIRWGVIGAGGIADRRTIPGLLLAKNAELRAVMEINADFAERLRAKYGANKAYDSCEALVADTELDAVYIASPVYLHAEQMKLAADAGKHILVEKPVALTSTEGQNILSYCEEKGVKVAAGFMMRFGTHIQAMKKAVMAGKIGSIVSGYSQFTCWLPDIEGNWRQSKSMAGGGALMDMGIHCIDLFQYITGSTVTEVSSFCDTITFSYEVEDSASLMLRMENGAVYVLQCNFNIPPEVAKWRIELFGTHGRLIGDAVIGQIDAGRLDITYIENMGPNDKLQCNKLIVEPTDTEFGNMYTREIESFSASLLNGTPIEVPAEEAVKAQKIIEAAYLSSDTKVSVRL